MRDPKRIDPILELIRKAWVEHPDYRLMQLLGNTYGNIDPYYIEDDDLLSRLERHYLPEREAFS